MLVGSTPEGKVTIRPVCWAWAMPPRVADAVDTLGSMMMLPAEMGVMDSRTMLPLARDIPRGLARRGVAWWMMDAGTVDDARLLRALLTLEVLICLLLVRELRGKSSELVCVCRCCRRPWAVL